MPFCVLVETQHLLVWQTKWIEICLWELLLDDVTSRRSLVCVWPVESGHWIPFCLLLFVLVNLTLVDVCYRAKAAASKRNRSKHETPLTNRKRGLVPRTCTVCLATNVFICGGAFHPVMARPLPRF